MDCFILEVIKHITMVKNTRNCPIIRSIDVDRALHDLGLPLCSNDIFITYWYERILLMIPLLCSLLLKVGKPNIILYTYRFKWI